jgi:hypothetical protein
LSYAFMVVARFAGVNQHFFGSSNHDRSVVVAGAQRIATPKKKRAGDAHRPVFFASHAGCPAPCCAFSA